MKIRMYEVKQGKTPILCQERDCTEPAIAMLEVSELPGNQELQVFLCMDHTMNIGKEAAMMVAQFAIKHSPLRGIDNANNN